MNTEELTLIKRFLNDCYDAGIKHPVAFLLAKMPQVYSWLKGAFPRGILPTDVDGEVEINGYFLRFEFKSEAVLREGLIPEGQHRCIKALQRTGVFTTLIVGLNWCGYPTCLQVYNQDGSQTGICPATRATIRDYCSQWSEWVEGLGRITDSW